MSTKKTKAPCSRRFVWKSFPTIDEKELNAEVCSVSLQSKQRRNISVISHIEREGHRPEKGI